MLNMLLEPHQPFTLITNNSLIINNSIDFYKKVLNFEDDVCQLKESSIHLIPFMKTFSPWTEYVCR